MYTLYPRTTLCLVHSCGSRSILLCLCAHNTDYAVNVPAGRNRCMQMWSKVANKSRRLRWYGVAPESVGFELKIFRKINRLTIEVPISPSPSRNFRKNVQRTRTFSNSPFKVKNEAELLFLPYLLNGYEYTQILIGFHSGFILKSCISPSLSKPYSVAFLVQ